MYVVEGLTGVHGGEGNVRRVGEYEALEDAIKASKKVIDAFLISKFEDGTSAAALFAQYQKFGEVPFIFCDDPGAINVNGFNHFEYALSQCGAICIRIESTPAK